MKSFLATIAMMLVLWFSVSSAIAEEGSFTSLEEATKVAQEQGKDILVDFTGSDWCGWCTKLHDEVFGTEEWKKAASKKYVMVILDFPRNKQLDKEVKEYNAKLQREYGIQGFPTILVLDSNGKIYAKTGYQPGGAKKYLAHLEEFAGRKTKRDELLKQAKDTPQEKRLPILTGLIEQLTKWEIDFAYPEIKDDIVSLDGQNKSGLRLKYATELTLYYYKNGNKEKADSCLGIVAKIDADKAKELETEMKLYTISSTYMAKGDWEGALDALKNLMDDNMKGECAQKVCYAAAIANYKLSNKDKAIETLEKALACAPNSKLAARITQELNALKK